MIAVKSMKKWRICRGLDRIDKGVYNLLNMKGVNYGDQFTKRSKD